MKLALGALFLMSTVAAWPSRRTARRSLLSRRCATLLGIGAVERARVRRC